MEPYELARTCGSESSTLWRSVTAKTLEAAGGQDLMTLSIRLPRRGSAGRCGEFENRFLPLLNGPRLQGKAELDPTDMTDKLIGLTAGVGLRRSAQ